MELHVKRLFLNGYVVAVLAVFAILLVLESLQPIFGGSPPLLLFLVAVLFATWFGDFRAGCFATVLSAVASVYFLEEPYDSLYIAEERERLRVALLLAVGMLMSVVIARLRTMERRALHEVIERKAQLKAEIAEHRQTEKRRSELEEQMAKIVATVPLAICSFRLKPDGTACLPYASPRWTEIYGLPPEDLVDDAAPAFALVHPDDLEYLHATMTESARTLCEWQAEWRIRHPVKGEIWIEGRAVPEIEPEGGILGHGFIHDVTERKKAEEALRQSDEELTGLFNTVPIPVWIAQDARCDVVIANPPAIALLGVDAAANMGQSVEHSPQMNVVQRWPKVRFAPIELPLQRAIATGRPVEATALEVVLPTGKRRFLTGRAAPLFHRDGCPRGAVAALADITELVQDFMQSEARFHAFMDNSPAVAWMKDEQGRYAYLSKTYEDRMRVRLDDWRGKTDFELWPRESAEQFQKNDREALTHGKTVEITEEAPDADGKRCCWWIFKFPFQDAAGNKFVGGVALDITERKRVEEALQTSEALNRAILDSLLEHVAVVDREGNILAVNQAWQRFARENSPEPGVPVPGTQVGANYLEVCRDSSGVVSAEASSAYTGILGVLKGERESFTLEYPCHAPDQERWFVMQVTPLRAPSGAAVISHTNITERKQAEEMLREADRRKTEFLAMLGHELRNPLAPIRNAVQIMHKLDVNHPRVLWARDVVDRQVDHLARLVDDLLDVSRIVQGKLTLHKAPLDIATVIHQAIETSQSYIEAQHHTFSASMPNEPMPLEGDLVRLTQVVSNLLNNAAKYTRQGGRIWLTVTREDGEAVISVRDTGEGIPSTLLPYLFDIFTQGQRTLDRSQGGLGLGLTIVRKIVELHGGRIEAKSDGPGKGSEFIVRLPLISALP
ncbi:PAS domain-containing protein [Methylocaldum sp.]|uniref:PAS domain-containing sensor histidine kinase n=1 Tax=Methylocaldum sp. TaxID=1969727 RepID=UPI002D56D523|nr:PAS domain-containing protein [Methylocaldum sp.]HYE36218.1 PAS domain-containing protein [Methylocaldum sp.]